MINLDKIIKISTNLKNHFNSYDFSLHCGGCGFAALYIHNEFLKLGIDTTIKVLDFELPILDIAKIEAEIEKNDEIDLYSNYGINLVHIVNKFGNYYIDMEDLLHEQEYLEYLYDRDLVESITISSHRLQKILKYKPNWNSEYNRKFNRRIKRDIIRSFRE